MAEKKQIPVTYIESNVPIPVRYTKKSFHESLKKLEVDQSFVVPLVDRPALQAYASHLKKTRGLEFTVHKIDDEQCRVWRTK